MTFWTTFLVAVGLGADAFSVALSVGFGGATFRQTFRLTFHFGLFQAFMPAIGWSLGQQAVGHVSRYDRWIAFGLLAGIGLKMFYEAFQEDEEEKGRGDKTRGWSLVMLSFATSIDAMGVGIGMGLSSSILFKPCLLIGLVAASMTFVGLRLGERLSRAFGQRLEVVGALILIGSGFKMLSI